MAFLLLSLWFLTPASQESKENQTKIRWCSYQRLIYPHQAWRLGRTDRRRWEQSETYSPAAEHCAPAQPLPLWWKYDSACNIFFPPSWKSLSAPVPSRPVMGLAPNPKAAEGLPASALYIEGRKGVGVWIDRLQYEYWSASGRTEQSHWVNHYQWRPVWQKCTQFWSH